MRKTLYLIATAAATAMAVSAGPTVASAATASTHPRAITSDVLTIGTTGGTDLALKATLHAGLQSGESLSFGFSLDGSTVTITCTKASLSLKTDANAAVPGTAKLTLTKQSAGVPECTATARTAGLVDSVKEVTFTNTHLTTISDASGDPVTLTGPEVKFVVTTATRNLSCIYQSTKLTGAASNASTGLTIAFNNQAFNVREPESDKACPSTGLTFTATYGPFTDQSVSGKPDVFVN